MVAIRGATAEDKTLEHMVSGIIAIVSMWIGRHLARAGSTTEERRENIKDAEEFIDERLDTKTKREYMTREEIKQHIEEINAEIKNKQSE